MRFVYGVLITLVVMFSIAIALEIIQNLCKEKPKRKRLDALLSENKVAFCTAFSSLFMLGILSLFD